MKRILLIYGGASGLLCTLILILNTWFTIENSRSNYSILIGYASIALCSGIIIMGMQKIARLRNFKFNLLFGSGVLMLLILCSLYALGWMAFYNSKAIDFKAYYKSQLEETWKGENLSEEELIYSRDEFEIKWNQYSRPINMAIYSFSEPFLPGLLILLVASAFLSAYEGGLPAKNKIE
jgi:hypothetical protein